MTRMHAVRRLRSAAIVAAAIGSLTQCRDSGGESRLVAPDEFSAAKSAPTTAPSVATADPPYGRQGDVGYRVRITGSGFEVGARASWERNGVADPKVAVRSTEFVSSTELVATIDIAADADLDLYDVAVMSGRGKGIGTEMFEVTGAIAIGSLDGDPTFVRGINSRGQATGYSGNQAFYWDAETSVMIDLGPGHGWDIDEAGVTIVGASGGHAAVWTRTLTGWQMTPLPREAGIVSSRAAAVGSDPLTGEAVYIAGEERFREGHRPRLWRREGSAWVKVVLTFPVAKGNAWANDVNGRGQVAGRVIPARGAEFKMLWEPDGSYVIGPGGMGINEAGTITVFNDANVASYMELRDGTWTGPHRLPGNCTTATAVDNDGRIVASGCLDGDRRSAAVFVPPYDVNGPLFLGGLGRFDESMVEPISQRNGWIGGKGAVWSPFLF